LYFINITWDTKMAAKIYRSLYFWYGCYVFFSFYSVSVGAIFKVYD